jgi:5-methylcytosine-specific restriction endonuclease McrA
VIRRGPGSLYNTARYRRAKKRFFATVPPYCAWVDCPVPGGFVDVRLSGNHPLGPTVDHRVPATDAASFWAAANWSLMHRRCNSAKGRGVEIPVDRSYPTGPSRDW